METKSPLCLCFVIVVSLVMANCGKQEGTVCLDYCDMKTVAVNQDAVNQLCEIYPNDLDLFEDKCLRTCNEILTYVVDKEEQGEASNCLKCIVDNAQDPTWQSISEAKETCFRECNNLGGYQFFFTFFVSDPQWHCTEEEW